MDKITKKLPVEEGKLFTIKGEDRHLVSKCKAEIELREHSVSVPVLGKGRIVDGRIVVLLITFDHKPDIPDIYDVDGFSFQGFIRRKDGIRENVVFSNCMILDDLDLTDAGKCTLEVRCSENMVKIIKSM